MSGYAEVLVDDHHDVHQVEAVQVERLQQRGFGRNGRPVDFEFIGQYSIDLFYEFLFCHF